VVNNLVYSPGLVCAGGGAGAAGVPGKARENKFVVPLGGAAGGATGGCAIGGVLPGAAGPPNIFVNAPGS